MLLAFVTIKAKGAGAQPREGGRPHSSESMEIKESKYLLPVVLILAIGAVMIFWIQSAWSPLIDYFSFRQCQTAMTALWFDLENPLRGLFFYETPEFGEPWAIPFEFPIYQAIVAFLSHLTGVEITAIGRMTSAAFLLASLVPIYSLFKSLNFQLNTFLFSSFFLLSSPLYLYWSRTFMIESTAVFFGFCFLSILCLAFKKWSSLLFLVALICGILCALVKVTTFPSFALAAGLAVIAIELKSSKRMSRGKMLAGMILIFLMVFLCVFVAFLWTKHADGLKSLNPISAHLVSDSLSKWNYGTLDQRFTKTFWGSLVWGRVIPEAIGMQLCTIVILIGFIFARSYERIVLVCLLGLFLFPLLLFTNLHLVHRYYQYANSFWLILALGVAVGVLAECARPWATAMIVSTILFSQIQTFAVRYYHATKWSQSAVLEVGATIDKETPTHSAILVAGDDWSPEVAFYSQRKAIYIPNWKGGYFEVDEKVFLQALADPQTLLGDLPLSAIVVRGKDFEASSLPPERRVAVHELIDRMGEPLERKTFEDYVVYIYQRKNSTGP